LRRGLIGVGGFIPSALLLDNGVKNGEMGIVFGANGFFGYGYNTSSPRGQKKNLPYETCEPGNEANWWSTYYLDECPDWRLVDSEDAKRQLVARHSSWKNPVIQEIIKNVQIDSVYPTWTTPELPTWERAGLVLVGDAAHALHPSSGQGANQALEDSECFSLLLSHHLRAAYLKPQNSQWKTERVAVEQAAKDYSNMRMPRLEKIRERSAAIGDFKKPKTLVQEMFMYLFIWSISEPLPESLARITLTLPTRILPSRHLYSSTHQL
jgi:2-polyprenyl-6-methoxyphenol hydroxylase-like FAD-dependent oxidoreductase